LKPTKAALKGRGFQRRMFADLHHVHLVHARAYLSGLLAEEANQFKWDAMELDPDQSMGCDQFTYCDSSPFAFAETQLDNMESWFATDQTGWLGRDGLWGATGKQSGLAICHVQGAGFASSVTCTDPYADADDVEKGGPGVYADS